MDVFNEEPADLDLLGVGAGCSVVEDAGVVVDEEVLVVLVVLVVEVVDVVGSVVVVVVEVEVVVAKVVSFEADIVLAACVVLF